MLTARNNLTAKAFAGLFLLLMLPVVAFGSGKVERKTFLSRNKKHSYYLFVPERTGSAAAAPLIILFHGSGRDGMSLIDKWRDVAGKEGLILAGLNSIDSSQWNTTADGPDVIRDLVEDIKAAYSIDLRRIYLFGHSGGAVFAILLSQMESEYFAAAAVHAGSLRASEEFKFVERSRRGIPLAIWIGTQDPFFSLASVQATKDALMARGSPVQVTPMPGHDHWYYDLAPSINEAAWKFLKQYALTSDPRYQDYSETERKPDGNDAIAGVNQAVAEINAGKTRVNALVAEVNAREIALNSKDLVNDRAEINNVAKAESDLLKEAAAVSRSIAEKASQTVTPGLEERYRRYLELIAQHNLKYAEMLDVMRQQAEALLSNESGEAINSRRAEAQKRIEALRQEADSLYKQAEKLVH
jgi:poly(3-hydroxybutyrate) depolymerase